MTSKKSIPFKQAGNNDLYRGSASFCGICLGIRPCCCKIHRDPIWCGFVQAQARKAGCFVVWGVENATSGLEMSMLVAVYCIMQDIGMCMMINTSVLCLYKIHGETIQYSLIFFSLQYVFTRVPYINIPGPLKVPRMHQ